MSYYATLAEVKAEMLAESTIDDAKVMNGIRQVSARIDEIFQSGVSLFTPYLETREIALDSASINSGNRTMMLRTTDGVVSPLLSLTSVVIGSNTLVVGTNVRLYPPNRSPYTQLQLVGDAYNSWYRYAYCSDAWGVQFSSIAGIWGYNRRYASAWLAVDVIATTAITTTTATTFTVADVDGANPLGQLPRISAGHLIQIDSEWMDVISTTPATNTVTVLRGVNGSTAATHAIGATVSVYSVDEAIKRAVIRQVAFQYSRAGAYDTVRISDFSTVTFPKDILDEFYHLIALFANL